MSRDRIVITAQLEQGCTAGCGRRIEVGMPITHGTTGWQHLACAQAAPDWARHGRILRITEPDDLTTRLEKHRHELTDDEIAYLEDMIRRRHGRTR